MLAVLSNCLLRLVSRFSKSAASTGAALLTTLLSSALVLFVRCSDLSTAATAAFSSPLLKPETLATAALLLLPLLFVLPTPMLAAFSGLPLLLLVFLTVLAAAAMVLLYAPLPLPLIVRRMLRPLGVSMSTSKSVSGSMVAAASAVGGGKQGSIACRRNGLVSLHAQLKTRSCISGVRKFMLPFKCLKMLFSSEAMLP